MLVNFTKMHSLGNDFIVLDLISQPFKLQPNHVIRLADRHLGIGCDQILLIEPPISPTSDFFFRAFNADGQEAEQCGNGIRCAARHVVNSGLVNKTKLVADSLSGPIGIEIKSHQLIEVDLGAPRSTIVSHQLNIADLHAVNSINVPIRPTSSLKNNISTAIPADTSAGISTDVCGENISTSSANSTHSTNVSNLLAEVTEIHAISMGNPHGICIVNELSNTNVTAWGEILSSLPCFPQQANISFMQILSTDQINLTVYERGVGATLACGSAACAAVAVANFLGKTLHTVKVNFSLGHVTVTIDAVSKHIYLLGSATSVYLGKFHA